MTRCAAPALQLSFGILLLFYCYCTGIVLLSTGVLLVLYWCCTAFYCCSTAIVLVLYCCCTGCGLAWFWTETGQGLVGRRLPGRATSCCMGCF